jgi:ubiquinone/menaquinone biosynthesis C-methylase UbiE
VISRVAGLASNVLFWVNALFFGLRDLFFPLGKKLREAGIERGDHVLDYGCGIGSYSLAAAELVGDTGRIYALDIHPLALRWVQKAAARRGLANVETINSDCATALKNESIDVVLLYDTFHILSDPQAVLQELRRVLRPEGHLSFSDHHMKEEAIVSKMTDDRYFKLSRRGKRAYAFSPENRRN